LDTTASENVRHAFATGLTTQVGEKNSFAKLSDKEVLEIRKLYVRGRITHEAIAEKFNVSRSLISYILNRKIRRNV
jgi:DNA-binding MarR family transcriptional regulator